MAGTPCAKTRFALLPGHDDTTSEAQKKYQEEPWPTG
jgi:hypothetical protein